MRLCYNSDTETTSLLRRLTAYISFTLDFPQWATDHFIAQRFLLHLVCLNCHRFNCHGRCVRRNWEADKWVNGFQFLAGQTASVAWELIHASDSRRHVRKIHIANISATRITSPSALNKSNLASAAPFSEDDKCKLTPDSGTFSGTLSWFIGRKAKAVWCARWDECCGSSDMDAGLRLVSLNGRRRFWLDATEHICRSWETHTNLFLLRYSTRTKTARMGSE